jgi:hypothetical protein
MNRWFLCAALALAAPGLAGAANFESMQIELVVGGIGGDTAGQAIELRMRVMDQGQVQQARLIVVDANGANPIVVADLAQPVANAAQGDRVLVATAKFRQQQLVAPDVIATNAIPAAYLAGGKLIYAADDGSIYWSVCWGTYNGPTTGLTTNDADGVFGPCAAGALPSAGLTALKFKNNETAPSTNNAADYAITASTAIFHNNARNSAGLQAPLLSDGFE